LRSKSGLSGDGLSQREASSNDVGAGFGRADLNGVLSVLPARGVFLRTGLGVRPLGANSPAALRSMSGNSADGVGCPVALRGEHAPSCCRGVSREARGEQNPVRLRSKRGRSGDGLRLVASSGEPQCLDSLDKALLALLPCPGGCSAAAGTVSKARKRL